MLSRRLSVRRRGLRRTGFGIALLIGALITQVTPSAAVAADEASPYVHAIEEVLIESVEVKGLISRDLLTRLGGAVDKELTPALKETRLAILETYLTPGPARLTRGASRPDDGSHAQSLVTARDRLEEASGLIEPEASSVESIRESLRSALETVEAAANGAAGSNAAAKRLQDATAAIRTSQFIATNALDELIEATRSDISMAIARIETAQTTPTQERAYAEAVDAALAIVEASADRQAQLVSSLDAIAARNDEASHMLYDVAADETVGVAERDLVIAAQEQVVAAQTQLPQPQDAAASASSLLYDARSDLAHARSAGSPDTLAVLTDSYRSKVAEAQQISIATASMSFDMEGVASQVATAAEAALVDLETIDLDGLGLEDQEAFALKALRANLHTLLSSAIRVGVGIDAATFEFAQAGDALARITTDEVRVQETVLNASFASFDHLYIALLDGDNLKLAETSARLAAAHDSASLAAGGVGNNVHNSVLTVDRAQSQRESTAWQAAEESPGTSETGTGGTNGDDCRDETEHHDGHTVYVHYGDAGDDNCEGSAGNDVFWMRGGNDYARAHGGPDQLHMGGGEDEGRADAGNDELWGGAHGDQLFGSDGDDYIQDTEDQTLDHDYLSGGPQRDTCNMKDGDADDGFFGGDGKDPEPTFDQVCYVGKGCKYDYYESAGGVDHFPP